MRALLLLFLLLGPSGGRAAQDFCGQIEREFSPIERLDFHHCAEADQTRTRFAVQLGDLLKGCRELASFDRSLGLKRYQELSVRFRNRVLYEFLTSPTDARETERETTREALLCQAEMEPLMRFRRHALTKLIELDDAMESGIREKAPGSPETEREKAPD